MPLDGKLFTVPAGTRGFDANFKLKQSILDEFVALKYRFAIRYIRRDPFHEKDLDAEEARRVLGAGLGLMPVQHVESEDSWMPSGKKGRAFGRTAADTARACGFPRDVTVWCDLEGVAADAPREDVSAYCNAWFVAVKEAGFTPGLYVGHNPGLGPKGLFALPFEHYWGAYNLNRDEEPATRGIQMKQHALDEETLDRLGLDAADLIPPGFEVGDFQFDIVREDAKHGLPTLVAPLNWLD